MGGDLDQALETLCRLTSHAVLRRHLRLDVPNDIDAFAAEDPNRRLRAVDDYEPEGLLIQEHVLERLEEELGIATVQEGGDRFWRLQRVLHHLRLIADRGDLTDEEHHAIQRGRLEVFQPGKDGLDGALDRLPGAL